MKHIKLFEEAKNYEISDDLIKSGLDDMLEHYMEEGRRGGRPKFKDMIENIEYFYDNRDENSRWHYHIQAWKEIVEEIVYERMCYNIIESLKEDPSLYAKHKKFIEDMMDGQSTYEVEEWMKRGGDTGLLNLEK